MKKLIEDKRILGEIYGIPTESADRLVIIPSEGIDAVTEDLYALLMEELKTHAKKT